MFDLNRKQLPARAPSRSATVDSSLGPHAHPTPLSSSSSDFPASGHPPVFSLSPSTDHPQQRHLHVTNTNESEKIQGSPWFRKPSPHHRRLTAPIIAPLPRAPGQDDVELGGEGAEDPERNMVCGCSKANFIVIVFFMIVLVAAAVGGGVGGSLFASQSWARDASYHANSTLDSTSSP